MKLYIERLTPLFLIAVLFLWGCAGCGQKTELKGLEPQDDFNEQSNYGPVAVNTLEPVEFSPFPEPSLEDLRKQFKADIAANRGSSEVLERKRKAIANPNILEWPFFVSDGDNKNEERPLTKLYRYERITIKITKDQEKRMHALMHESLPIDTYKKRKYEIFFEGVDSLTASNINIVPRKLLSAKTPK